MTKARPKSKRKATARPIHRTWETPWKELIATYGGTADAFAKMLGVSGMQVGRWADGLSRPNEVTQRHVNKLAVELGVRKLPFP